jgi:hypothetical protein
MEDVNWNEINDIFERGMFIKVSPIIDHVNITIDKIYKKHWDYLQLEKKYADKFPFDKFEADIRMCLPKLSDKSIGQIISYHRFMTR